MERCLIWMLYPYTIVVLHAVLMNTTKYEAFWEKLVCASAGCCFVPCTAARRCRFPIRDCQRTGQWDARTSYVEEIGFSTFHHPSRLLHVHALHLVHTKRWATFSLLLIRETVGHRLIKFVSRSELLGLDFVAPNSTCEELNKICKKWCRDEYGEAGEDPVGCGEAAADICSSRGGDTTHGAAVAAWRSGWSTKREFLSEHGL